MGWCNELWSSDTGFAPMKNRRAKSIALFVWKGDLIIGVLSFGYLAKYSPGPGLIPLGLMYLANLIIISVALYLVAERGDRKVK